MQQPSIRHHFQVGRQTLSRQPQALLHGVLLLAVCGLTACGGGGSSGKAEPSSQVAAFGSAQTLYASPSSAQAYRALEQASFGPTPVTISEVQSQGIGAWVSQQLNMPASTPTNLAMVEASAAALGQNYARSSDVLNAWWTHAVTRPDQLRQRLAYALSQIFVVSASSSALSENGRMVASYMDMLTDKSTSTYRDLLEGVALHPAMGLYLSHMYNRKEDPLSGRVPDENFAREVMQLFTIGLYELSDDGTQKLRNGQPIETYTSDDVKGLAKVFTGLGWHRPAAYAGPWWECFYGGGACNLPQTSHVQAMGLYPEAHSISEKRFLGESVAAQSVPNPAASIKQALDRLATHPNTAPFISKQLIQRLVTSNPSPAYVSRVTQVFRGTGGNLKAVASAILLDTEARQPPAGAELARYGKLREPVLRWTHLMRVLPHVSTRQQLAQGGGFYLATDTSNPTTGLAQAPMYAPSVFNFYRPGYKPPQTQLSSAQMVAPEMQLTTETSVMGYATFVTEALTYGWGQWNPQTKRNDIQFDLSSFTALDDAAHAMQPQPLVDAVAMRLLDRKLPADLNGKVLQAVASMPRGTADALRRRTVAAIVLVAVSPEFLVQQ